MSATVADKFLDAGGIRFHYREAGEGEKTIVFLHGAGGQSPRSARFLALLGERHRVLVPSRPGFDETPVGDCRTIGGVVEAVAKFIAAAAPGQKVHLVAQSAGGAIGAWLAILHPELVASLVLSAPAAFAVRHAPPPGAVPPNLADMAMRLYGDQPAWDSPPSAEERAQTAKNAQANLARFAAPEGHNDLRARLAEIEVLTLLLVAGADRMIPAEAMRPYQELIPRCTRIILYGAAHEMPIAAAEIWVKLVGDFVARGEYFLVNMG
ncbi:MAG TPA: alpha/beta hydrolase [Stellaceae bacterium]|nr:alpha/beta hydrolase [Stellaceae bacterium]